MIRGDMNEFARAVHKSAPKLNAVNKKNNAREVRNSPPHFPPWWAPEILDLMGEIKRRTWQEMLKTAMTKSEIPAELVLDCKGILADRKIWGDDWAKYLLMRMWLTVTLLSATQPEGAQISMTPEAMALLWDLGLATIGNSET